MSHTTRILLSLASCALVAGSLHAQAILNETWANGNRDTQALPTSSQWFSSGANDTLNAQEGSMTLLGGTTRYALTYFTTPGEDGSISPIELQKGQSLNLTYDISFTGIKTTPKSGGGENVPWLRIGLFNSQATDTSDNKRVTEDNKGSSYSRYVGYTGYVIDETNILAGGDTRFRARKDGATSNNLMTSLGSTIYNTISGSTGAGLGGMYESSTDIATFIYTGHLSIGYGEDDSGNDIILLTQNVYDADGEIVYSLSVTDSANLFTKFDTLVFALASSTDSMTLHGVNISLGQIPEPSTFAAIGALAALGATLYFKRRRARHSL